MRARSIRRELLRGLLAGLFAIALFVSSAHQAQAQFSLIRDAEIERDLEILTRPIFIGAGLDPGAVNLFLVNENQINAFVAGGQNIFIFTGLIMASETPGELMGVIAHETGHITGGHLARSQEAAKATAIPMLIGLLLGAAAVAAGSPDAGIATIGATQQVAQRTQLSYSRTQEAAADQAAVTLLDRAGVSSVGLLAFFHRLEQQDLIASAGRPRDPYVRSHPLSRERIALLQERVESSRNVARPDPAEYRQMLIRMKAKLEGFLDDPDRVIARYPPSEQSLKARYARAVAYHRQSLIEPALGEINSLIAEFPDDPYFRELKGQIFFEHGRIHEAVASYREAVKRAPGESLLNLLLGQALLALEDSAVDREARDRLELSVRQDKENSFAWHQLAIAYAHLDERGMAALATAERHMLTGNAKEAFYQATDAQKHLPENSPAWVRAQDILVMLKRQTGRG